MDCCWLNYTDQTDPVAGFASFAGIVLYHQYQYSLSYYTVPCQNVLDYFKTVLEFHNQLVQSMPEDQLTEVRKQASTEDRGLRQLCIAFQEHSQEGIMLNVHSFNWSENVELQRTLSLQEEERQTVFEVCDFI